MNTLFAINLGGDGEIPGVLNQQGPWALNPNWESVDGRPLAALVADGHAFLICPNTQLPLPDESCGVVSTNNVPVGIVAYHGPGVQVSEIHRILKSGGQWIHDGLPVWIKP
jgi:hypothetical protein